MLTADHGIKKTAQREQYLAKGRHHDCNQRYVFDENGDKLWWHIEFLSRHDDDLPYNHSLTYNTRIISRKRRPFYLAERQVATILKLNRKTIRKHLNNFLAKGLLVVIRKARYAPSMPGQARATVYALGKNFHHVPHTRPTADNDGSKATSLIAQRVVHTSAICIQKTTNDSRTNDSDLGNGGRNDTCKAKSNGKPLPCQCPSSFNPLTEQKDRQEKITDLEIEEINTSLPSYLSPRLFLSKSERKESKRKSREKQHLAGITLYEEVLRNVGKPGESGRCTSEEWTKGIPYHPDYVSLTPVETDKFGEKFYHLDTNKTTYVPKRNLPQMYPDDSRRPKCPKCAKQNRRNAMRLSLNWNEGTCYWQCPTEPKHQLPISLNYAFEYQKRDGFGNWRKHASHKIKGLYQLCSQYMSESSEWNRELTNDQYLGYLEGIMSKDETVCRRLYDIHIRNNTEFLEEMVEAGIIERREVA